MKSTQGPHEQNGKAVKLTSFRHHVLQIKMKYKIKRGKHEEKTGNEVGE